jgi:DNA-binding CsgD family transcriptional regulator
MSISHTAVAPELPGPRAAEQAAAPPARRPPTPAEEHPHAPPQAGSPFSAIVLADSSGPLAERLYTTLTAAGAVDIRFATSAADLLRRVPVPQQTGVGVICRSPRAEAVTQLVLAMRQRGWRRLLIACDDGGEPAVRLAIAAKVRCLIRRSDPWSVPGVWSLSRSAYPQGLASLSPREVQVLQAVADGRSNSETGALLGLSGLTVKSHLARIGRKIGTGDRAEMVAMAMRAGVIS